MNGVRPTATAVLKLPELDGAAGNIGEDAVGDITEDDIVDSPVAAGPVELEVVIDRWACGWREIDDRQGRRNGAGVGHGRVGDDEAHDFIRVEVILCWEAVSSTSTTMSEIK